MFRINDSAGRCIDNPTISSNLATTLIFDHLFCELPTSTYQSKPTNVEKAVVRNWCENDASVRRILQILSRKFHSSSLCPSPLGRDKKWACSAELRHIFIDNRSAVLLHHISAMACLGMECQMAQRSYLERNHRNPADSALSAAASSVGSTARSIVHFSRQSSLGPFHP